MEAFIDFFFWFPQFTFMNQKDKWKSYLWKNMEIETEKKVNKIILESNEYRKSF